MTDLRLELEQLINQGISSKLFPACVIGAITPHQATIVFGGNYTYEDQRTIRPDSVFDVASLTKVIPTSSLALKLIEEKKLDLKDDICQYLPGYKSKVTVWNLLTQTVYYEFGFPLSSLAHQSADEILEIIFKAPVKISKDEHHYTNTSSILLGMIVEKVYGEDLPTAAAKVFFEPLGMKRTGFNPLSFINPNEIVPTELDSSGKAIHTIVHDESTRAFLPKPVGSAGLFTTVPDLHIFLKMLLKKGRLNGKIYFAPDTIAKMGHNQLKGGAYHGLGWELNQPRYMGKYAKGTFGKTGFTGCLVLVNPKLASALVILSNHIHPKRPQSFKPINDFRRNAADLVFGSAVAKELQ